MRNVNTGNALQTYPSMCQTVKNYRQLIELGYSVLPDLEFLVYTHRDEMASSNLPQFVGLLHTLTLADL
jgi:hypothetical protein